MIGEVTFGVIGLLFLFADVRTFASTFQQTFFGAPNTNLAIMAAAVFATSFLALVIASRLGPTRALGSSAALFVVATVLATASRSNWADLALTVVALAAGFWWLAFLHSARAGDATSPLVSAFPLAFAVDLALRAAFRTIAVPDLAWPLALAIVLLAAFVFIASGLTALAPARQWHRPDVRGLLGLIAVPSLLLVADTGATNGAQVAIAGGLGTGPEPARATQIGQVVLGLGIAAGAFAAWRIGARAVVAGVFVAAGAVLLWAHVPFASLAGGALLAAGVISASAALTGAPLRSVASPAGVVVAMSLGWLVFVAGAFGFYALWAYYPALWAVTALVAVAAALAPVGVRVGRLAALAAGVVAVAVPVAQYVATPAADELLATKNTFRVMTYNIHQGFDAAQIPSLDAIVDAISQESPDVLLLQEVVRGWTIDEEQDTLSVIAERLRMPYVFLPNIGDLYGDAVLSRFPMTDVRRVHYALEPGIKHQPRGALIVRTADVVIVCTHLDDLTDGTFVRQEQVRTIIREVGDASPLIVGGDLNAPPDAIEIRLLNEFGLDDLGAPAGDTTTMDNPQKRIDYVWGRGVVGAQAHTVLRMDASDHRALVVNVTVTKR